MTDALFWNFIDGRFEEPSATFDSVDPSTGALWAKMPAATEADVDRAVEAAHRALRSGPWRTMTATGLLPPSSRVV